MFVQFPQAFLIAVALFVLPPAWIHVNWVFNPEYLFTSNGARRIRFSEHVEAQVSLKSNIVNDFGIPRLPVDLRTSPSRGVGGADQSAHLEMTLTRVLWDDYLYIPGRALIPAGPFPKRTLSAILEFGPDGLMLSAGLWRPGVVLELPYSRIIGVWNGSQIKTIDSGGVLVVVVDSGDDDLLFPFDVVRVTPKQSPRAAVEALVRLLEERRQGPTATVEGRET